MTWLYYLIPFAAVAVAVALIRRDTRGLRDILAEADQRRRRLMTATPLDAAMERIVPAVSVHKCGCAVVYHDGGDARLAPCPGHARHADWWQWERQMQGHGQ